VGGKRATRIGIELVINVLFGYQPSLTMVAFAGRGTKGRTKAAIPSDKVLKEEGNEKRFFNIPLAILFYVRRNRAQEP